jgi:hypothetical protein
MRISLDFGPNNKHRLEYSRNWFTGRERLEVDGKLIASRSIISVSNYVSFPLCRRYECTIDSETPLHVVFEKQRPLLVAGIRPHTYRVIVDGSVIFNQRGY